MAVLVYHLVDALHQAGKDGNTVRQPEQCPACHLCRVVGVEQAYYLVDGVETAAQVEELALLQMGVGNACTAHALACVENIVQREVGVRFQ